ncbi:hypothetical protein ACUX42_16240, partial [Salmonella enterica]|uniref:hypothetical protein n=1 Tax=Salmonella enterica TaxID=28901 RepID=UPI001F27436F
MISMTKADLRLAVQRLISSSIVMLMSVISTHYDLSRISVGHYISSVAFLIIVKHPQYKKDAAGFIDSTR